MTPNRLLVINAVTTSACAIAMLAARAVLTPLFGLDTPMLLDVVALGLLPYAGALALASRQRPASRRALIAFSAADAAWVVASAVVLLLFWGQLAPIARLLVIAAALVVELFATLQFRAAGRVAGRSALIA